MIRDELGGEGGWGYVGVHLRLGDGTFRSESENNARFVWWQLMTRVFRVTIEDTQKVEASAMNRVDPLPPPLGALAADKTSLRFPHPMPPLTLIRRHTRCRPFKPLFSLPNSNVSLGDLLTFPIFIATDSKSPRTDPSLTLFHRTFPCMFFLSDFPSQLEFLHPLTNDLDGLPLGGFLMPFVDAMVAAMGHDVVGTPHSTFSRFTVDVLFRAYHGWPIVERGV